MEQKLISTAFSQDPDHEVRVAEDGTQPSSPGPFLSPTSSCLRKWGSTRSRVGRQRPLVRPDEVTNARRLATTGGMK